MNRYESAKKVGLWGIIGNIFLLIIKLIISITSQSKAMFADAINSAGDIFSSLMTFIGSRIASIKEDEDHNFGHGKAEYIFSLLISIFMLIISCKLLVDSILSILNHQEFIFSSFLVIVCIITILTKLSLYLYCKNLSKKHNNILIEASMKDHRNDIFLSIGTLVSIILSSLGFYYFDGIFGSLIAIYIMFTGITIFLESYKVLMDVAITTREKKAIIEHILKNKEVINVHDFYTTPTGYKYIAIISIDVDGNLTTFKSHEVADTLEKSIPKSFSKIYKVIIHVNSVKAGIEKEEDNSY